MKKLIIDSIIQFVTESEFNRLINTSSPYYYQPLVKFATAHDPLFEEYKQIIGPFHLTPREAFELKYGKGSFNEGTVISVVLPVNEVIRKRNRTHKESVLSYLKPNKLRYPSNAITFTYLKLHRFPD